MYHDYSRYYEITPVTIRSVQLLCGYSELLLLFSMAANFLMDLLSVS